MRIGLHIGKFRWPGSPANIGGKLAEIARAADDAGFYSLWVMDHLFQLGEHYGPIHGPVDDPMLEGYSTIAYLAAVTQRIKVGVQVTCTPFRAPGLLVKTISSIDVLSGGRTYLGLGAGWFEREALGLGIPFPPLSERFERLEEALQIVQQMWRGDVSPYEGKHYQLAEPLNSPQPLSQPHPPILVGGGGEKKTLRLVAQYADACNLVVPPGGSFPAPDAAKRSFEDACAYLRGKLGVLEQHCQDVGRAYDEIEKTATTYILLTPGAQEPAEVIELCQLLAGTGFQHVIFNMFNVDEIRPLEVMGKEVIPEVAAL